MLSTEPLFPNHRRNREWRAANADRFVREGRWSGRTVAAWARDLVARDPDRIVIVDGDHEHSAGALVAKAEALSAYLVSRGFRPGDVISYQLPNWHETAIISLAAAMAGLVLHHIVPAHRESEVGFALEDCGSRMLFIPGTFRNYDYRQMMRAVGTGVEVVVVRDDAQEFLTFDTLLQFADRPAMPAVRSDAPKFVMYTSGTTSRPKGVVHSHDSSYADILFPSTEMELTADSTYMVAPPVTHVAAYGFGQEVPFILGAKAVFIDIWSPERALELIRRHRCTQFHGPTPFLMGLLDAAAPGETFPELRSVGSGGAGVPPELIRETAKLFPNARVFRSYGCTEVPCITGAPPREAAERGATTDGSTVRTEIRLAPGSVTEDGLTGTGEILARGAQMMLGYLHAEDNESAYDEEGFFRTGDIARIADGYLTIIDRKKDIIIRNGENISAKEIEDALYGTPDLADLALVAMPHPKTGECGCLFVVPTVGGAPTLESVCASLDKAGVNRRKWPERLVIIAALPRSTQGKVLKQDLREQARDLAEHDQQAQTDRDVKANMA